MRDKMRLAEAAVVRTMAVREATMSATRAVTEAVAMGSNSRPVVTVVVVVVVGVATVAEDRVPVHAVVARGRTNGPPPGGMAAVEADLGR